MLLVNVERASSFVAVRGYGLPALAPISPNLVSPGRLKLKELDKQIYAS
jgi:hypothetical protein